MIFIYENIIFPSVSNGGIRLKALNYPGDIQVC
jgi:hypothetical protein